MNSLVEAQLRSDAGYLRLRAAESQGPFAYVVNPLAAPRGQPRWAEGRVAQSLGAAQLPAYEILLSQGTRTTDPVGGNAPSTELFGTAPVKTVGRGGLLNDQGRALEFIAGSRPEPRTRRVTEVTFDTLDFQTQPLAVEPSLDARFGESSRAGPVYARTARE